MFKFIGYAASYVWHLIQAGLGNPLPLAEDYGVTPTAVDTVTVESVTKEKANLTQSGESIIGLRDPVLVKNPSTFTTTTFDTTTYGDRAVLKLTNLTGSALSLTGLSIRGKIVSQMAGQNGYIWEYSDYDAIEKEGEKYAEISNDFIFDPVQAKQIGDFSWKELKPHKLYSLMLPGCHYEYEIGDVYHLTLNHTMNGGTMEDIDSDVEVMGVSINRSVGGVGETNLNLRVPSAAWALTIAKNSKLVGAGNAQRLNNRSNVVTVASSTWTGQADYYCDGTDDDIEIQAAIDYMYSLDGGKVILTEGSFNLGNYIEIKNNIYLQGSGTNTLLYGDNASQRTIYITSEYSAIKDFALAAIVATGVYTGIEVYSTIQYSENIIDSITIYGIKATQATGIIDTSPYNSTVVSNCNIKNIETTNASTDSRGISQTTRCFNNVVNGVTATTSPRGIGFSICYKCQQNLALNCQTKYSDCFADSAGVSTYAAADTANGGFNS